jgi:hypothetical protein
MPAVNCQGQAHIVSTAIPLPRSGKAGREVEATPWFRTWLSVDPQPASISPTINISIVFICAFPVDCDQIICHSAIKNDSGAILRRGKRFVLGADEKLTAFVELESAVRACGELNRQAGEIFPKLPGYETKHHQFQTYLRSSALRSSKTRKRSIRRRTEAMARRTMARGILQRGKTPFLA